MLSRSYRSIREDSGRYATNKVDHCHSCLVRRESESRNL